MRQGAAVRDDDGATSDAERDDRRGEHDSIHRVADLLVSGGRNIMKARPRARLEPCAGPRRGPPELNRRKGAATSERAAVTVRRPDPAAQSGEKYRRVPRVEERLALRIAWIFDLAGAQNSRASLDGQKPRRRRAGAGDAAQHAPQLQSRRAPARSGRIRRARHSDPIRRDRLQQGASNSVR